MIQFQAQDPHFVESREVTWNDLYPEDQHKISIKGKNLEHEEEVGNMCAQHSYLSNFAREKEGTCGPNEESPVGLVRPTVVPGVGAQLQR